MYKHAIIIFFLLSFAFSSQSVQAQEITGPVYIVQPGDSLSSIAVRFNVNLTDLMSANGITDPNQLGAGQQLVIPGLEGVTGLLNTEVINFGDSYRSLVRRTQIPQNLFKKLNHLVSPSEFYIGAPMIMPANAVSDLTTRVSIGAGESLLELAVKQNTDAWTLAYYNQLQGSWDTIPGDTLFTTGGTIDQTISGLPSAFISAEIRDLPIKQGGTGVIKVKTIPNVTLGGILVDHPLHFFPMDDGTQVALQGVHALLPPGVYPLRLDATLPDGSVQSYEQFIVINTGNYGSEIIPLNDSSTIDPAVTEPELQQIVSIVSEETPGRYWESVLTNPSTYPDCYTSRYGTYRTYKVLNTEIQLPGFHTGLDFCGGEGLDIMAPAAGKVVFASPLTVRGNATIIDHGWGVYSGFWHQSKINVEVGQIVQQSDVIGLVGGTGRVTGAHLHWELWVNGIQVDPMDWLMLPYP